MLWFYLFILKKEFPDNLINFQNFKKQKNKWPIRLKQIYSFYFNLMFYFYIMH